MNEPTTLEEARDWLAERMDEGADCPCCGQRAQVYRRKINSGMARALIVMWRAAGTGWCHVPTVVGGRSSDECKLVYWGLIEEERVRRPDGGRAGWWRVTEDGARYVHGQLLLPKYALIYNGDCLGLEGERVGILSALGTKFDYDDLMAGR